MTEHYALDGGGVLRAAGPPVRTPGVLPGAALSGPLGRPDVRRGVEYAVLALGALLVTGTYILVPLVTALYSLTGAVFAALTLGLAILTQFALLVMYVVRRTEAPRPPSALPSGTWPGRRLREAKA